MKKSILVLPLAMMALFLVTSPKLVSAHGHTSFEIDEKVYSFVVGSLNEPIAVDDKTGVDLRVSVMTHHEHEESERSGVEHIGKPVTGLETTLKVELQAGDKKKVLDFSPAFRDPGAYRAYFTPTVQTTYSYRIFGTLDKVPFDYTFTCNPAGHPQAEEDKTEVEVSKGVMRIETGGAFGCPIAKADLGFPEQSASIYDLNAKDQDLRNAAGQAQSTANSSRSMGLAGVVIGLLGLIAGTGAWMKGRKV